MAGWQTEEVVLWDAVCVNLDADYRADCESNLVLKHEKKKNIHLIRFIEGENREKTER